MNVLLELLTFELFMEFGDDFKLISFTKGWIFEPAPGANGGEGFSDISIKPGKRKSSQARSEEVREGETMDVPGISTWSSGLWAGTARCLSPGRCMWHWPRWSCWGQAASALSCSFPSFLVLICPLLLSPLSLQRGLAGSLFAGAIQSQCGITQWGWHPGLMLRGRNTLADTPLFIQAINNSHKNLLLSLLCSAKPCQWERRWHLFYRRLEAGFAFFWLT